jgi:peptidoglycan hydrolase-like protein with peptidoglycan-binding domain
MGIDDVKRVFGHKEWAPGRKIDPAGIDMDAFRNEVRKALDDGNSARIFLKNLKPGDSSPAIRRVKRRLKKKGFFDGPITPNWTKEFRDAYAEYQKSLGYKGNNANGVPGETSLQKLGFRVIT